MALKAYLEYSTHVGYVYIRIFHFSKSLISQLSNALSPGNLTHKVAEISQFEFSKRKWVFWYSDHFFYAYFMKDFGAAFFRKAFFLQLF